MRAEKRAATWPAGIVLCAAFTVVMAACGVGGTPKAQINRAVLTRAVDADKKPTTDPLTTFAPTDPAFHLAVEVVNAPPDTVVKASWWAVDAGASKNVKADEAMVSMSGSRWIDFSLTRQNDAWPKGTYRVDLTLNDKPAQSIEFTVS